MSAGRGEHPPSPVVAVGQVWAGNVYSGGAIWLGNSYRCLAVDLICHSRGIAVRCHQRHARRSAIEPLFSDVPTSDARILESALSPPGGQLSKCSSAVQASRRGLWSGRRRRRAIHADRCQQLGTRLLCLNRTGGFDFNSVHDLHVETLFQRREISLLRTLNSSEYRSDCTGLCRGSGLRKSRRRLGQQSP